MGEPLTEQERCALRDWDTYRVTDADKLEGMDLERVKQIWIDAYLTGIGVGQYEL